MMIWSILRFFLFLLDPERAHRFTIALIRLSPVLRIVCGAEREYYPAGRRPRVLGMEFLSRVGLAAGFDKDGEIIQRLPQLGFGFAEIGTVTPLPQPGNEPPRLFRDPARRSIFNRMGFNGLGAEVVAKHLREAQSSLPEGFRVGVNLGKNKATPLERAASDYSKAAAHFKDLADYLVINVSSPNTPQLRSLQTIEGLKPIVGAVHEVSGRWERRPPLLLKFAPELPVESLSQLMKGAEGWGVDGWVLTNTLAGQFGQWEGGWSGACLKEASRESLVHARACTRLPIISVGGIMSVEEALERRRLGADLVQLYTGWIYGGPRFPAAVSRAIAKN